MIILLIISVVVILICLLCLKGFENSTQFYFIQNTALGVVLVILSLWVCYIFGVSNSSNVVEIILIWAWLCTFYNYSLYYGNKFYGEAEIKNNKLKISVCYASPIFSTGLISFFIWFCIKSEGFTIIKISFSEIFIPTLISSILGTYRGISNNKNLKNEN